MRNEVKDYSLKGLLAISGDTESSRLADTERYIVDSDTNHAPVEKFTEETWKNNDDELIRSMKVDWATNAFYRQFGRMPNTNNSDLPVLERFAKYAPTTVEELSVLEFNWKDVIKNIFYADFLLMNYVISRTEYEAELEKFSYDRWFILNVYSGEQESISQS